MKRYAFNVSVESAGFRNVSFRIYFNTGDLLHCILHFVVIIALQLSIFIRPDVESISLIMLNEHSIISAAKMLRQGQTKVFNTGYLFVLNALFYQTSNLAFSSGNGNSESVTNFSISGEYSPQQLGNKKVSKYCFKFKRFPCVKDDWIRGSKAKNDLSRGLFDAYFF